MAVSSDADRRVRLDDRTIDLPIGRRRPRRSPCPSATRITPTSRSSSVPATCASAAPRRATSWTASWSVASLEQDRAGPRAPAGVRRPGWNGCRGSSATGRIGVTGELPVRMEVKAGAADVDLDCRDLRLDELVVRSGASSVHVRAAAHGRSRIRTETGAGSLEVTVPDGVAARVRTTRRARLARDRPRPLPGRCRRLRDALASARPQIASRSTPRRRSARCASVRARRSG